MRTKHLLMGLALLATSFISCDDDDDDNYVPNQNVLNTFEERYGTATNVKWENKYNYAVAEFRQNGQSVSVWIENNGTWQMTETDITFEALPEKIKTHFNASEYSTWIKDDIDQLERKDMATIYVIEVEKNDQEVDLHYDANGTLLKVELEHNGSENIPATIPESVKQFIAEHYTNAIITDSDYERGFLEIDILDNNISKDVLFDSKYEWISTSWDIRKSDVPENVINIINTDYSGYEIDDIEYQERADGKEVYIFELEKGNKEIKVSIDKEGNLLQ